MLETLKVDQLWPKLLACDGSESDSTSNANKTGIAMALIEIDLQPSKSQLRWFGLILFIFFSLLGAIVFFVFDAPGLAYGLWTVATIASIVYYAVRPFQRPLYLGWMYLAWPIGWTISHLLLAAIYYLLITPIGLVMRILGRDSMQIKPNTEDQTYWVEHRTGDHPSRYFRQF